MMKKYLAEMVGTMVLVLIGCGAAVSLGCNPVADQASVVGTALAFGLSVVAMAYTIGGISGCHINPAITLGVFLSGRMNARDCGMYMLFQIVGGIMGAAVLYAVTTSAGLIGTGANDLQVVNGACVTIAPLGGFLAETFFTCVFVLVSPLRIFIAGALAGGALAAGIWKLIERSKKLTYRDMNISLPISGKGYSFTLP